MEKKPLRRVQQRKLTIQTLFGDVTLQAEYGRDPASGKMLMPLREELGLQGHQPMSPALEERLCSLALTATSYGRAAEVARKFGIVTDDSQIQRLVQRVGERAEAQAQKRITSAFTASGQKQAIQAAARDYRDEEFSLVLMLDGTMLRSRGADWGLKPASSPGERVVWHELKAGLAVRIPERAVGKREDSEKYYVATAGGPEDVGRALYAEALRRGLHQARRVYVIADGAVWIWRISAKYFPEAVEELDYYHASEHLWALARDLFGDDADSACEWVRPLLTNLKHRGGGSILPVLEELLSVSEDEWGEGEDSVLRREKAYFENHLPRLCYPEAKRDGMPLGSGAMESACGQIQGRFKRTGQFWSKDGEKMLLALELAWRNGDWKEIWDRAA